MGPLTKPQLVAGTSDKYIVSKSFLQKIANKSMSQDGNAMLSNIESLVQQLKQMEAGESAQGADGADTGEAGGTKEASVQDPSDLTGEKPAKKTKKATDAEKETEHEQAGEYADKANDATGTAPHDAGEPADETEHEGHDMEKALDELEDEAGTASEEAEGRLHDVQPSASTEAQEGELEKAFRRMMFKMMGLGKKTVVRRSLEQGQHEHLRVTKSVIQENIALKSRIGNLESMVGEIFDGFGIAEKDLVEAKKSQQAATRQIETRRPGGSSDAGELMSIFAREVAKELGAGGLNTAVKKSNNAWGQTQGNGRRAESVQEAIAMTKAADPNSRGEALESSHLLTKWINRESRGMVGRR